MEDRQRAFQRLKPPCVELNSTALKFRLGQVPVKDVLEALKGVHAVLLALGNDNKLDHKLAEYAFWPLAQQVFNQSKTLSSRCLEVATNAVTVLVTKGYRQQLLPEMGKQLLIMMAMLVGAGPQDQKQASPDELKTATFECIKAIVEALSATDNGMTVLKDQGTKNIVDQLFYLLLQSVEDGKVESVQLTASQTLNTLVEAVQSRVFLASLLPRTVSSLTKALKVSTQIRRSQSVLAENISTMSAMIERVLADNVVNKPSAEDEDGVLDDSWLKATAGQMKNALTIVSKLRSSDKPVVRKALTRLCLLIIEECFKTLSDSVQIMFDTLVALSAYDEGTAALEACRHIVLTNDSVASMLRTSILNWSQALPRVMQGNDDRPKVTILSRLGTATILLNDTPTSATSIVGALVPMLVNGISSSMKYSDTLPTRQQLIGDITNDLEALSLSRAPREASYPSLFLAQQSQREEAVQLDRLLSTIRNGNMRDDALRLLFRMVQDTEGDAQAIATWLATKLLEDDSHTMHEADEFLDLSEYGSLVSTRKELLGELHALTFDIISRGDRPDDESIGLWRLQALAMQAAVFYAESFPGDSYRPDLIDTLYPILSLIGSDNTILRSYSMISLDRLAVACQYSSTSELIISNADYLVNSVAWKLNTHNLSPEAPQILSMMVKLCGVKLVPYLDDLVQSMFAALDMYHGNTNWVELLFSTLQTIVNECVKAPHLAITNTNVRTTQTRSETSRSGVTDVLDDIRARKRRRLDYARDAEEAPTKAPERPWTTALDGPTFPKEQPSNAELTEDESENLPAPKANEEDAKLSRTHQLLLNIANSTTPHLASPSPRVRQLLLKVLHDAAPLLARDENSFLPLINGVWPVVVPRLLNEDDEDIQIGGEAAYNMCAAAETIAILCKNAGNFMSSRIETISEQTIKLFKSVTISAQSHPRGLAHDASNASKSLSDESLTSRRTVDLEIIEQTKKQESSETTLMSLSENTRTSKGEVLKSLVSMLEAILSHVQLALDTSDAMVGLLLPYTASNAKCRDIVEKYNADMLWLYELRTKDQIMGSQNCSAVPSLPQDLLDHGIYLHPVTV